MNTRNIFAFICSLALLQGCAAVVVAGGATAVSSATDRRTVGSQIDDNGIVIKANRAIKEDSITADNGNINVTSYNGIVLLTGQVTSEQVRQQAASIVQPIQGVRDIHNQIRLGNVTSVTTKTRDSWITTKVKSQLLANKEVSAQNIRVITENGEVFLMGLVSGAEADKAVDIARNVEGVSRVIKAFEHP